MQLKDIVASLESKSVKNDLDKINSSATKHFLKGNLTTLPQSFGTSEACITAINQKANNSISNFAGTLLSKPKTLQKFIKAVEKQAKSKGTKTNGLFYKEIYQNKKLLESSQIGDMQNMLDHINKFILAKRDSDIERTHNASISAKLKTPRLSNFNKVFIALTAYEYLSEKIKLEQKREHDPNEIDLDQLLYELNSGAQPSRRSASIAPSKPLPTPNSMRNRNANPNPYATMARTSKPLPPLPKHEPKTTTQQTPKNSKRDFLEEGDLILKKFGRKINKADKIYQKNLLNYLNKWRRQGGNIDDPYFREIFYIFRNFAGNIRDVNNYTPPESLLETLTRIIPNRDNPGSIYSAPPADIKKFIVQFVPNGEQLAKEIFEALEK